VTTETPLRNDSVTMMINCAYCGRPFKPSGRRRHCSDACRVAAWRRRHAQPVAPAPLPPKGHRREVTVYECGDCGERSLGSQRCESCNRWMRAIGVGGSCPACDAPVAITELTEGGGC
jgi:hypothetical protein